MSAWEDGVALAQAVATDDAEATKRLLAEVEDWGPVAWWLARQLVDALRAFADDDPCVPDADAEVVGVLRKFAEVIGNIEAQNRDDGREWEANPPTIAELRDDGWPEVWGDSD